MPKAKTESQQRIWIELDQPPKSATMAEREAFRAKQIELANNMLQRLGVTREFWWSEREARYCIGDPMGYKVLSDDGEWFNLEYLGRPADFFVPIWTAMGGRFVILRAARGVPGLGAAEVEAVQIVGDGKSKTLRAQDALDFLDQMTHSNDISHLCETTMRDERWENSSTL